MPSRSLSAPSTRPVRQLMLLAVPPLAAPLLAMSLLAMSLPATGITLVLQQGSDGYTGCHDTFVSSLDWDTPPQYTLSYGQTDILRLSRDGDDNPLLRFDLAAIPANSQVVSATLELYNTTRSSGSGTQDLARRIRVHEVLVAWDEGNQDASGMDAPGDHGATGD